MPASADLFTRAAEIVARRAVASGAAAVEIEAIRARGVVQATAQRAASSGKRAP